MNSTSQEKWIPVYEYAKLVGKSKQQIYLDIRTGKIPEEKVKKVKVESERIRIKVD